MSLGTTKIENFVFLDKIFVVVRRIGFIMEIKFSGLRLAGL